MFESEVRCAGPDPRKAHALRGDANARHVSYIPTAKNVCSDSEVLRAGVRLGFFAILEPFQRLACGRFSGIFATRKLSHSTLLATHTNHQVNTPSVDDVQPAPVVSADNSTEDVGAARVTVVINIVMAVRLYDH